MLVLRAVSVALLVLAPLAGSARAGDDEGPRIPPELETRIYEVGDLTMGRVAFDAEAGPTALIAPAHDVNVPEGKERVAPFPSVADLVRAIEPEIQEAKGDAPGAALTGQGSDLIQTRLPRAARERLEAILARLRAEHLPAVALDLAVVEGDPAAARGAGGLGAAVAGGGLRVQAGARVVGQVGHRATAFVGRERAFVTAYEPQVAKGSRTADPTVQVQPEGLSVEATVREVAPTPTVVLRAWTARIAERREAGTADGTRFTALTVDAPVIEATLRLETGAWSFVVLSAQRWLAVRATRLDPPPSRPTPPFARANLPPTGPDAPPLPAGERGFSDVHDFCAKTSVEQADWIGLVGSGSPQSEGPALPESMGFVPEDLVKEVVTTTVDPGGWAREGAGIEVRWWQVVVAQDAAHRQAVGDVLSSMRARFVGSLRFRATVVRLPLASFPEWWAGGTEAERAVEGGAESLLARPGAEVVDGAAVRVPRRGVRNSSFAGVVRSYVRDYDVEIAEDGAAIGNPIVSIVREGISLDVEAAVAAGGAGVQCQVRLDRSSLEGMREATTPHGVVECPDLALLRARGGLVVPFGATRLVGLGIEEGQATLVLLTANVE